MDPHQQIPTSAPSPTVISSGSETPMLPDETGKKRLLVIGAVIVGVILLGGIIATVSHYFLTKAPIAASGSNPNHPEDHTYETTVGLTQNGFTPATVTVKPSTEVFFDNNSTNPEGEPGTPRRIIQSKAAGNQEPYFYSDPISTKSEYGHTFRTPGTYQFYDPDNVKSTLTVIVQ